MFVVIKAGVRLMRRVFVDILYKEKMNYDFVFMIVFILFEYGMIGMSEEFVVEMYGVDNVECYVFYFKFLEWTLNYEEYKGVFVCGDNVCYVKFIINLVDDECVVGFYYLGLNVGEVM